MIPTLRRTTKPGDAAANGINLVFSNQHGLNLRNNVAHGAFGTDDDAQIASLWA